MKDQATRLSVGDLRPGQSFTYLGNRYTIPVLDGFEVTRNSNPKHQIVIAGNTITALRKDASPIYNITRN